MSFSIVSVVMSLQSIPEEYRLPIAGCVPLTVSLLLPFLWSQSRSLEMAKIRGERPSVVKVDTIRIAVVVLALATVNEYVNLAAYWFASQ